ncbi:MAG: energy-coupling factor transporter transmembrane component T, partial [bacterium]|nr:energy-coupling factor transporter transmembrane component T [bacterium]
LFALLMNAFRRAEHVTLALEARGYDPCVTRTYWQEHPLRPMHVAFTAGFIIVCAVAPWI